MCLAKSGWLQHIGICKNKCVINRNEEQLHECPCPEDCKSAVQRPHSRRDGIKPRLRLSRQGISGKALSRYIHHRIQEQRRHSRCLPYFLILQGQKERESGEGDEGDNY